MGFSKDQFRQPYSGPAPDSLRTLFNAAHAAIAALPPLFSSEGFPGSLYWTTVSFTPEEIDVALSKSNSGLLVSFHRHEMPGIPISESLREIGFTLNISGSRESNGIAGLSPEVVGPRGRYLTGLVEPCGALPRKCYLFIPISEWPSAYTLKKKKNK
jgi:hypothetical protein